MWREYFGRCPAPGRSGVIFTFTPENTVPQAFVDWLFAEMLRRGVGVVSVGITASEAVLEGRMALAQRRQFQKLADVGLYRQLRGSGAFALPAIPRTDLRIDTGRVTPLDAARLIANSAGLEAVRP